MIKNKKNQASLLPYINLNLLKERRKNPHKNEHQTFRLH